MFLKNRFLNTTAFLMAPDGERSAADIARDNIKVASIEADKEEVEKEEEVELEEENKEEEKEEIEEEEIEPEEKSEDDEKNERERTKMQKRIDRLSAKQKTTEAENLELKRLLEAKIKDGEVPLTEDEVERRAELKAQEKADLREFNNAQERLIKEATKVDKDFMKNIKAMSDDIGLIPPIMIAILDDLDDKGKVLDYLSKNADETEDIYKMSEAKMAVALAKLEVRLAKKKTNPISRVPDVNKPLGGGSRAPATLSDNMSDDDWITRRNADRRAAGKM